MKIHPHDRLLEEFLLSLSGDRRELLMHLARCSYCRARLYYLPRPEPRPAEAEEETAEVLPWRGPAAGPGAAVAEGMRKAWRWGFSLEKERAEALGLFTELTARSAEQREVLLRNAPKFHTWGLFELLVERSGEEGIRNPAWAEEVGLLALRLSEHLDPNAYSAELIEDLRARAWACVGNACRVRSDLHAAEEAFAKAYSHLKKGTGEPVERALLLDLKGSLLRDQRRFDAALGLLERAVSLFLSSGERHRAGRSLVKMSIVHSHAGNTEAGIPLLFRALELIDAEQEPRLLLCAKHNLIVYLAESGRFMEAQAFYRETRPLYRNFPDAWTQNRRNWVKGKIARGLGQPERAESLFLAARDGFVGEGIPYDTALVSLELATLYAEQGRTADLKRLAQEMVPIFTSRQIHREALAALAFLQQAMAAERASAELVARVAAFLRRAQHDPAQPFEAPA